ncbi:hypothetical protein [uncultured Maritimibacter sp.]|uniref:hypothetical protein n=1 Tax=uncultured Maritimibacter sp. TaxID=991866 RepID=UPI002594A625|nr:hypothetical protein [uncultured Maritimibacter sp.]
MSFLRPEALNGLARWRDVLIGAAVALAGLRWVLVGVGLMPWIGGAVMLLGAVYLWTGFQRARFRTGSGGLGVVEVDERQITYLAPVGGGIAAIDALTQVSVVASRAGGAFWRFDMAGERLSVPAAAEGARAVFDVLTALPGARIETAIRALNQPPETPVTIWRKGPAGVDTPRAIEHS